MPNDPGCKLYFADPPLSEGDEPPYHWKWNETIGPLIDRPGRPGNHEFLLIKPCRTIYSTNQGTWGYENTDGLGLVEYMEVCHELKGLRT